ncbi:Predicted Fe-Mo cluster-binding protein, NifX family [Desulfuromusa kysingii]|uniref:Predicted Fe-Mo cluster-binding protein, NifX family n=1 Tax=Desulfuromusa kysingii TaxID=37625 RepID=A0A1H3YQ89_9BACT|nr:NifB/NifX family molybdenum-iron cluster-binding protein [Desulfuromusa kysingii]SEA13726.1 Predicted Fe-Mo cluster-binding protein, NifX family [Desulfuromusa kysingii]
MQKIRVCIGSIDGETISPTHMGDTECFYLYDLSFNHEPVFVEKRANVAQNMQHDGADKMQAIITLIHDVDVLVARQKSPNFVKIATQTRYQPVVVKHDNLQDVLALLQTDLEQIYAHVERRKTGEVFATIPVIG